jgi:hypothetical protein
LLPDRLTVSIGGPQIGLRPVPTIAGPSFCTPLYRSRPGDAEVGVRKVAFGDIGTFFTLRLVGGVLCFRCFSSLFKLIVCDTRCVSQRSAREHVREGISYPSTSRRSDTSRSIGVLVRDCCAIGEILVDLITEGRSRYEMAFFPAVQF